MTNQFTRMFSTWAKELRDYRGSLFRLVSGITNIRAACTGE